MCVTSNKKNIFALPFILFFVFLSMFLNWEIGGETWGYWYFSEILKETGDFIVFDRSPIYILYLNLFNWLDYPYSVNIEYVFTTSICSFALFLFSRVFLNFPASIIAACICIPFMQISEPPVQKLALAFTLFSLLVRLNGDNRKKIAASYTFLIIAYCFRQTYLLFLLAYLVLDITHLYKQKKIFDIKKITIKFGTDWPFILAIMLIIYFLFNQSPSSWNNVWFTDTKWFPSDGKTMRDAGGIQILNMFYILKTYGTYAGHDFYLTNKVAFNDAQNFASAILANPSMFIKMVISNLKIFIPTFLTHLYDPNIETWLFKVFYKVLIICGIFYGCLKFCIQNKIINFYIGSCLLFLVLLISQPKARYLLPSIPFFIIASYYYSNIIVNKLYLYDIKNKIWPYKNVLVNTTFIIIFSLLSFSNIDKWAIASKNIMTQFKQNNYKILTNNNFSFKNSYMQLINLSNNCQGLMSLESLFLASFVNKNINYYSIYEIPPFGNLNDNKDSYGGLNLDRVDCVFVSTSLETAVGGGTNSQLRYENYIKPYTDLLIKNGALKYVVPNFGNAFILNKKR